MTFLVGWAYEHGQLPSEVLKQYNANPKDFRLLSAYGSYRAQKEKQEFDREKKKAEASAAR